MGGKKRKTPREWANLYEDLKVTKISKTRENSEESVAEVVLSCKCCGIEFDYEDSHISTRLRDHLTKAKSHMNKKIEFNKREKSGKQLTIEETSGQTQYS